MKLGVYAIYDAKAEAYLQPFFAQTRGMALRMFKDAANEEGHAFQRHAEDFTLFDIGEFEQDSGHLVPAATPTALGVALQFLDQVEGPASLSPVVRLPDHNEKDPMRGPNGT